MSDKWARDTLQAVNDVRLSNGMDKLYWCYELEYRIHRHIEGRTFAQHRVDKKVTQISCKHWTQPNVIADGLTSAITDMINPKCSRAAIVIYNNDRETCVKALCSSGRAVSFDELVERNHSMPSGIHVVPVIVHHKPRFRWVHRWLRKCFPRIKWASLLVNSIAGHIARSETMRVAMMYFFMLVLLPAGAIVSLASLWYLALGHNIIFGTVGLVSGIFLACLSAAMQHQLRRHKYGHLHWNN